MAVVVLEKPAVMAPASICGRIRKTAGRAVTPATRPKRVRPDSASAQEAGKLVVAGAVPPGKPVAAVTVLIQRPIHRIAAVAGARASMAVHSSADAQILAASARMDLSIVITTR